MDALLTGLRACAEPTRLRLLALSARGAFCVVELTDILGQSQPRLSRHLKLLCDAGLLERVREGANVWFTVAPGAALVRDLLARLPEDDPVLAADRRGAARVLVSVGCLEDRLLVEVVDDGVGGASAGGGGLTGLRKRVEALDGTLAVSSPGGGPTAIRAELPCGS